MSERFAKLPLSIMADRELTALAKVLFACISDFQGRNCDAWPGVRTLAEATGATVSGVLQGIAQLERAGHLEVTRAGTGRGNRYIIRSATQNTALHKAERSTKQDTSAPHNRAPALNRTERKRSETSSITRETIEPDHRTNPCARAVDHAVFHLFDGDASEPVPEQPAGKSRTKRTTWPAETINQIYCQYPRHEKPADARRAINKALATIAARHDVPDAAVWLLARVQQYAASREVLEVEHPKFVPYPASWMRAERFDEDPATWNHAGAGTKQSGPARQTGLASNDKYKDLLK